MISAVRAAGAMARRGDVVLLAPAAKSHDQFPRYAHRGTAFAAAGRARLRTAAGAEPGQGG